MMPAESSLTPLQKEIFEVKWSNCREKLGADIEGSMAKSMLECQKILGCNCCSSETVLEEIERKKEAKKQLAAGDQNNGITKNQIVDEGQGVETVIASREDLTILMELMMYQGKDINLVELFTMFKVIHCKAGFDDEVGDNELFLAEITKNFNIGIAQLKYMGFISATRQNTFIFKKNIFGKPKYYSTSVDPVAAPTGTTTMND